MLAEEVPAHLVFDPFTFQFDTLTHDPSAIQVVLSIGNELVLNLGSGLYFSSENWPVDL